MLIAKFIESGQEVSGSFFIYKLYPKFWLSGMKKKYSQLVIAEIPDYTPVKGCLVERSYGVRPYMQVSAKYGDHKYNKAINVYRMIDKIANGRDWDPNVEELVEVMYFGKLKVIKVIDIENPMQYNGFSIESLV